MRKRASSFWAKAGPGLLRDLHLYGGLVLIAVGDIGWKIAGGVLAYVALFHQREMNDDS